MSKYILVLFLLIIFSSTNAQTIEIKEFNKDLVRYYDLIDKAEQSLVNENYNSALNLYDKAFRIYKNSFAADLYNSALIASISGKYNKTYKYLAELSKLGLDPNSLKELKMLNGFWNSSYGKKAEVLDSLTPKTYDVEYRNTILELEEKDQHFRRMKNSYKLYMDTINSIDKENVDVLLNLIKTKGFPSERLTGVSRNGIKLPALVIIIHQNNRKGRVYNFSEIIKNAAFSGDLRNTTASYYIEGATGTRGGIYNPFSLIRGSYDSSFIVLDKMGNQIKKDTTFYTKWGYSKIEDSILKKNELNRSSLHLENTQLALKKDIFRMTKYPELVIGSPDSGLTFRRTKYSEFLYMKEHLSYLEE